MFKALPDMRMRLNRLDRSRTTPGNGLSLVTGIAQVHGTTLHLEDVPDGFCVRLRFPG